MAWPFGANGRHCRLQRVSQASLSQSLRLPSKFWLHQYVTRGGSLNYPQWGHLTPFFATLVNIDDPNMIFAVDPQRALLDGSFDVSHAVAVPETWLGGAFTLGHQL